jgi:hypothetical protein
MVFNDGPDHHGNFYVLAFCHHIHPESDEVRKGKDKSARKY